MMEDIATTKWTKSEMLHKMFYSVNWSVLYFANNYSTLEHSVLKPLLYETNNQIELCVC